MRILVIDGHPDPDPGRFGHALVQAYIEGAEAAGHEVRRLDVASLDFGFLRNKAEFEKGDVPPDIAEAQAAIREAGHIVLVFPLWLGSLPAHLKAFLEQTLRPRFAFEYTKRGTPKKLLAGRSARLVVTMGMPAPIYRWVFGAFGVRFIERNILRFAGIKPVRRSLIGMVEGAPAHRARWLARLRALGGKGR